MSCIFRKCAIGYVLSVKTQICQHALNIAKDPAFLFAAEITDQGPVVQSVVSLTSSLRVISLTVLADSTYNILIFFAEKM